MKKHAFTSLSAEMTIDFGCRLARHLKPGDILCLWGELGSGKTTFVKGIARGMGFPPEKVNSPTFVLMNMYKGRCPIFHFDFYRLEKTSEIAALGSEEFLYDKGVSLVEWAERFENLMPSEHLRVAFAHLSKDHRRISLTAVGKRYEEIVKSLKEYCV